MKLRTIGATLATGVAGALLAFAPSAASAAVVPLPGGPTTLAPSGQVCVGFSATSDAKGTGTADNPGVVYTMSLGGTEIYRTPTRRTGPFTTPVFVGAGSYQFCAKNAAGLGVNVNNVMITLLTDGDA